MGSTPTALSNAAQRFQADRLKFPGLLPEETIVLRAWLTLHQNEYNGFDYNCRIGPGDDPGPAFLPQVREGYIKNTQMRIDAVGWQIAGGPTFNDVIPQPVDMYKQFPNAHATIIEVKRRAGPTNIGQLATYYHAWVNQFPNTTPPALLLTCVTFSQNIVPALKNMNIIFEPVTADFSGLKVLAHVKGAK
jgi:hypothetical protein